MEVNTIDDLRRIYSKIHILNQIQFVLEDLVKNYGLDYNYLIKVFAPLYNALDIDINL